MPCGMKRMGTEAQTAVQLAVAGITILALTIRLLA